MDINRFTPAQQQAIRHIGDNLFIEAGAGTGKTATLTAKIAYMLDLPEPSSAVGAIGFDDISGLLAITFTRKAAGELTSRVRSTLRSIGRLEDASLVDDAWISTIHGMCSRILKEQALLLGVDPGFEVMDDSVAIEMKAEALNSVIKALDGIEGDEGLGDFNALFEEYGVKSTNPFASDSASDIVEKLMAKASTCKNYEADIVVGPKPASLELIAEHYMGALKACIRVLEECGLDTKTVQNALEAGRENGDRMDVAAQAGYSRQALYAAAGALKNMRSHKSLPEELKAIIADHKNAVETFKQELLAHAAWDYLQTALQLSQLTRAQYQAAKAQRGYLDNDDLLSLTYRVLEDNPELAKRYAQRFHMIMIDEFQDTDALQLLLADLLCHKGSCEMVTVGDAQQSIYRFRGADVSLFRGYERDLPQDACKVRLDYNFRSHPDVLAFVNRIFGQEEVFGQSYLDLKAPDIKRQKAFPDEEPRIEVIVTSGGSDESGKSTVSKKDLVAAQAFEIAQRFAQLHKDGKGIPASHMVVLLGKMTNSEVFASALRNVGFEVVIGGGSVFWRQYEPYIVSMFLRFLANPRDNEAAYQVLVSPLFNLEDDDLAALAYSEEGKRHTLAEGLGLYDGGPDSGKAAGESTTLPHSTRIDFARNVLTAAVNDTRLHSPSQVLRRLVAETGWPTRLLDQGASGTACCANIVKALAEVERLETDGYTGMNIMAIRFASLYDSQPASAPGALVTTGQEAVRIMTIHSSKGLEFPVVALAQFDETPKERGKFSLVTVQGKTFASLRATGKREDLGKISSNQYDGPVTPAQLAENPGGRSAYDARLSAFNHQEECAERRRLFYVGATRAREALLVCIAGKIGSEGTIEESQIRTDIARTLGFDELPLKSGEVDFGGSAPLQYRFVEVRLEEDLPCGLELVDESEDEAEEYWIPELKAEEPLRFSSIDTARDDFSYSSIASAHVSDFKHMPKGRKDTAEEDVEGAATDFGSAFHRVAEYLAVSGMLHRGEADKLDSERVDELVAEFKLDDVRRARLLEALQRWATSPIAKKASGYPVIRAEVPFRHVFGNATTQQGEPVTIFGEIDLLCLDESGKNALVVDYKTGGSLDESKEWLAEKHRLQALCYAEAVFKAGIQHATFFFVRVECPDGQGQPQTVEYEFDASQLDAIHKEINEVYQRSLASEG